MRGCITLLCAFAILLSGSPALAAKEISAPKQPIVVNGDSVEYFQDKKKVVGTGNISIDYNTVKLTCDKVTVYLDTREAIAEGNVKVTQANGAYFTGDAINYNFDTQKGSVINGYVNAFPFFGKAKSVNKYSEEEFGLDNGYVTTCELEHPHYRVQSKQIKIYLEDRIVAKNIFFYVGNTPIFYIPYYVQPIRHSKKTNFTVIPGKEKDWGYYVLTAYRYYFNDNFRGDILLDYRSKKGLGEGVNHYYETKDIGEGAAKFYYTHENDILAFEKTGDIKSRYRYQFRHQWDIGKGTDTTATVEFNKLSDPDVIKDYFYKEYEELQAPEDYNYISVVTTKDTYTTELLIKKRFDKFFSIVERLPEYRIDVKNSRLTEKAPVYYTANASAVYLNQTYSDTSVLADHKEVGVGRVDTYNQVSYAARLFNFWSFTPYVGTEQTYYSRNAWGDTNLVRGALKAGLDNSTKFYRIYDVESNFMGLDINKMRHIITPSANYYYVHQPSIDPSNLTQFDSVDALTADNGIRLSLENKIQTKRLEGEDMKSVDLATFIVSTDYGFRLKDDNLSYKTQKFKTVEMQLEATPYPWLYTLSDMTINTKKYMVEAASVDIVGSGGDQWSLGIGYRYENVETGSSNLTTIGAMYKINEKWKLRAYERFDLAKMGFEEQEYTIIRDLHCWIAEFTYDIKKMEDQSIWFVMRLKAFPETPIGFRRTYYRPRFGAVGN
jgi:lipopolysaccharide assembly outer membrane protein LptD (OstA)